MYRRKLHALLLITILIMVACAPADLDITPTITPIPIPTATPTPDPLQIGEATPEVAQNVDASNNIAVVEAILGAIPATIPAGAVQWRYDVTSGSQDVLAVPENGYVQQISLTEQQGSQATLTFGAFDTPEDAQAYYERISGLRDALARAETDENFPEPNLFGSGTYGAGAIFQQDNLFIEVALVVISSTAGDAVRPLARQALSILESGLGDLSASVEFMPTPEPELNVVTNEAIVEAILGAIPATIPAGAVQWRYDVTSGSQDVLAVPENGYVQQISLTEQQGSQATLTFGAFDTPEDAQVYYERISGLRDALARAETDENFPEPNLFGSGTYGAGAIFQQDNLFIEVALVVISSTAGDAVRPLARQALNIVANGLLLIETSNGEETASQDGLTFDALLEALPSSVGDFRRNNTPTVIEIETGEVATASYTGVSVISLTLGVFSSAGDAINFIANGIEPSSEALTAQLEIGEATFVVVSIDGNEFELFQEIIASVEASNGN